MVFTYSIFISLILIKSSWLIVNIPLRTTYYESLSYPAICIEISHKNPTGPLYLYGSFYYSRYSTKSGYRAQIYDSEYIFKRINRRCETILNITTLENGLKKLDIRISIYLSRSKDYLAVFEYTFYRGFRPGVYELLDIYKNFGTVIKVINGSQNYIWTPVSLVEDSQSYLQSIEGKNDELCVITKNNEAVVLKPNYGSNIPFGFVYSLQVVIFRNGVHLGERKYPTYACSKYSTYPDIPAVFITDGEKFTIKFKIIYRLYFSSLSLEYDTKEFNLTNPQFVDVHEFKSVPQTYNKLFLMRLRLDFIDCKDKSRVVLYFSEDGTRYFVDSTKKIRILPFVYAKRLIYHSIDDPCKEF